MNQSRDEDLPCSSSGRGPFLTFKQIPPIPYPTWNSMEFHSIHSMRCHASRGKAAGFISVPFKSARFDSCNRFPHQIRSSQFRSVYFSFHSTQSDFIQQLNSVQFNTIQLNSIHCNWTQFNSIQFGSVRFSSVQFSSVQFFV